MDFEVKQSVTPHAEGWWDWSIWLDGPEDDLHRVDYVEYILHQTFPQPVQKMTNREQHFRLRARGWGEFNIKVRVHLKDDDDEIITLEHWLELDEVAPTRGGQQTRIKGEQKPRLYISSGMADMEFAYELKEALEDDGIEVLLQQDLAYDQSLEEMLESQRSGSWAGLFLVSDVKNPWLGRDYWALAQKKVSSLVVQIGEPKDLPDEMRALPRLQVKDASESRSLAENIVRRVLEQF